MRMVPDDEEKQPVKWEKDSLEAAINLEKYFTTISLAGIALVTSLSETKGLIAASGLSLLVISAFLSLKSMIYLWETYTTKYLELPIKESFSAKQFKIQMIILLFGYAVLIYGHAIS